jgi:hypothetical protein
LVLTAVRRAGLIRALGGCSFGELIMRFILIGALMISFLAVCGAGKSNGNLNQAQNVTEQKSTESNISFRFLENSLTVKSGANVILKAVLSNRGAQSIYVADWTSSPAYYWQNNSVVDVSYIPFAYRTPEQGAGYVGGPPAAFYPKFREIKPGGYFEVVFKLNQEKYPLYRGEWQIQMQHLWVSDLKPLESLAGQGLVDTLKKDGHFVWARMNITVE